MLVLKVEMQHYSSCVPFEVTNCNNNCHSASEGCGSGRSIWRRGCTCWQLCYWLLWTLWLHWWPGHQQQMEVELYGKNCDCLHSNWGYNNLHYITKVFKMAVILWIWRIFLIYPATLLSSLQTAHWCVIFHLSQVLYHSFLGAIIL